MHKRSSKRTRKDINQIAASIIQAAAGGGRRKPSKRKNPAAVALGRLGGKKGGPARASMLTAERRAEIALAAAQTRWHRDAS